MDISFTPVSTANIVKSAPVPVQTAAGTEQIIPAAVPKAAPPDPHAAYNQAVKEALTSFKNTYAVSDHKFALFKDASGQMITRYVSLRDGTVTYTPAPNFLRPVHHVAIQA